ncbi:hypothetical protein ELI01_18965 [Rhizobium leguminosarum]|uniref:hypothetical protein n=1 Tax=Rhizobium leguminosarum TaxID=384 RepID=UPI00102F3FAE|nr:hypothetical protein [Rhizobium leguminosarum]TAX57160.1 hypothetical protein ELI01_18965 [Rhizobium leguminosarum]
MTQEEHAFLAAWKICSAWDGKITKPVLRKAIEAAVSEARAAALEEAAKVADAAKDMRERLFQENSASINASKAVQAEEIAAAIRALIPREESAS